MSNDKMEETGKPTTTTASPDISVDGNIGYVTVFGKKEFEIEIKNLDVQDELAALYISRQIVLKCLKVFKNQPRHMAINRKKIKEISDAAKVLGQFIATTAAAAKQDAVTDLIKQELPATPNE